MMKSHTCYVLNEIAFWLSVALLCLTSGFASLSYHNYINSGIFKPSASSVSVRSQFLHIQKPTPPEQIIVLEPTDPVVDAIFSIADDYDIDPNIVAAIVWVESRGVPTVTSSDGGYLGLMQVGPKWHRARMDRLGVTDLYDPYSNVLVGVDYLSEIYGRCHDWTLTVMSYNLGESGARSVYNSGQVTTYARRVLEKSAEFQQGGISYGS